MKLSNTLAVLLVFIITGSILPQAYAGSDTVIVFRSVEDPSVTADHAMCEHAPFYDPASPPNVFLAASLWSSATRANNGAVVNDSIQGIGTAHACARITSLSPGARAPFYMEFTVDGLRLSGSGDCAIASNNIPSPGIILAGCTLTIPADLSQHIGGGIATSNSVFNPLRLPDFQTGSFWTVHLY